MFSSFKRLIIYEMRVNDRQIKTNAHAGNGREIVTATQNIVQKHRRVVGERI